jgi:hypothetical protein
VFLFAFKSICHCLRELSIKVILCFVILDCHVATLIAAKSFLLYDLGLEGFSVLRSARVGEFRCKVTRGGTETSLLFGDGTCITYQSHKAALLGKVRLQSDH